MEIIILLVIIGVGLVWYYNNKAAEGRAKAADVSSQDVAPYKVEAPVVDLADIAIAQRPAPVAVEAPAEKPVKATKPKATAKPKAPTKPKATAKPKATNAKTPRKKKAAE